MTTDDRRWWSDLVESGNRLDDDNVKHAVGHIGPRRVLTQGRVWGELLLSETEEAGGGAST